ncbi:unnamed protein product [Didymodactylos carnosus]|uniref:Transmembrane protein n=1 Tax=Didymodactylos carnosus TaxID=1234261 RepID=A0A8S2CT05_9BILA|nr:unnamed protein product [Didymodactylos carnosus]CAF3579462.1 unnamed protein product [Didymodactylos carnosus]
MATRLYIVILIVSLLITTLYLSLGEELHRETALNPSESQYNHLQQTYPNSLICPCTSLSMSHQTFISIEPVYHQVCLSDFVSSAWIDFLAARQYNLFLFIYDKRYNVNTQFRLLSTLCENAQQTVNDSLRLFLQTQFVSSQVIAQEIFHSQINSLIEDWQVNTISRFQLGIQLVRATNQGNKIMNDFYNFNLQVDPTSGQVNVIPMNYSNCSCALYDVCSEVMPIFQNTEGPFVIERYRIRDFFTGCFPLEALLQSTLECLYNQTCVDDIQIPVIPLLYNDTLFNISALNITGQGPNEMIETVESMVSRLMINSWLRNISFTSYYNACAPTLCTFQYESRRQTLFVVLTVISVLSGLTTGLKILTLISVRFAEKMADSRLAPIQFVKNVFVCHNDQKLANRLQFVLLVITLCVLYVVSFVQPQFRSVEIPKPSLSIYRDLSTQFPDSLQCSCSNISFKYQTFLTIQPRFHQVCSSEFTSNSWIEYVYENDNLFPRFNHTDFRATATGQFQLLSSLCRLSQKTVNDSVSQLASTDFINAQLIASNLLDSRIQTTISEFQLRTPTSFISMLDLIRDVTGTNMLMSMYSTNWKYSDVNINKENPVLNIAPLDYQECDCGMTPKCTQPSRGMMAGCYPLEALLQSTLQCFYDQQCIDSNETFKSLNSSFVSSRFDVNSSIEFIVQQLMVEEYLVNKSYEKYFDQCSPSSCTYSYTGSQDEIDIATSLIGLYGGLVVISQWITVLSIKVYRSRRRRIYPQIQ